MVERKETSCDKFTSSVSVKLCQDAVKTLEQLEVGMEVYKKKAKSGVSEGMQRCFREVAEKANKQLKKVENRLERAERSSDIDALAKSDLRQAKKFAQKAVDALGSNECGGVPDLDAMLGAVKKEKKPKEERTSGDRNNRSLPSFNKMNDPKQYFKIGAPINSAKQLTTEMKTRWSEVRGRYHADKDDGTEYVVFLLVSKRRSTRGDMVPMTLGPPPPLGGWCVSEYFILFSGETKLRFLNIDLSSFEASIGSWLHDNLKPPKKNLPDWFNELPKDERKDFLLDSIHWPEEGPSLNCRYERN